MTTENNLAVVDWESHKPPTDLIFDDGEPLESNRHRIAMNVLIRSLQQAWADRNDYFTGGNMFTTAVPRLVTVISGVQIFLLSSMLTAITLDKAGLSGKKMVVIPM